MRRIDAGGVDGAAHRGLRDVVRIVNDRTGEVVERAPDPVDNQMADGKADVGMGAVHLVRIRTPDAARKTRGQKDG